MKNELSQIRVFFVVETFNSVVLTVHNVTTLIILIHSSWFLYLRLQLILLPHVDYCNCIWLLLWVSSCCSWHILSLLRSLEFILGISEYIFQLFKFSFSKHILNPCCRPNSQWYLFILWFIFILIFLVIKKLLLIAYL